MQLTTPQLEAGLATVLRSPRDEGTLELIASRPAEDQREVLASATLDPAEGLVGDNWRGRGNTRTPDGSADPDKQLNVMNARVAALVAGAPDRRALAGDQLYVDLDLSMDNLPAGSRLQIGEAVIEVTEPPHLGCAKFASRFGPDALHFVNTAEGRRLRLRGLNARVLIPGVVRTGDGVRKLATDAPHAADG